MIKFEDVLNITTKEYFNNNQFSIDAFEKKYAQVINGKKENYSQALKRVCDYIASAEKTEDEQKYWAERWFDEIYNDWWSPAGSIMQGANSNRGVSLSNCTTISLGNINKNVEWDSLEGIIKNTAYTVAKTAAHRQGLGVDFSAIRPKQFVVNNSSNESQGALHWMKLIDSIGNYIGQKGRIPAMLFSLSVNHPDIEDFIKVKSDYTSIQNANISVQTNDAFYKAVEDDADWELTFTVPGVQKGQKVYIDVHSSDMSTLQDEQGYYYIAKRDRKEEKISKTVKARELLQGIAKNMATYAEPGIQQMDMARKWSNSDYVYNPYDMYDSRIQSSNACSEQYLSRDSLCVLASINAAKFDADPEVYKPELKKIGFSVNRFLDNVNEMELRGQTYATPHQKLAIEKLRRTGAGITNIAGWLFKQNIEYGSALANSAMFEFNKVYNYHLYESSIELGKEKGSFGLFVREKYEQSPFIQEMMNLGLKFEAMRNVTCSSIAPNGCIEENTRIVTNKGLIKIKDLIELEKHPQEKQFQHDLPEIYAYDENSQSKITGFYNNGTVNGYVVEFEDGRTQKISETHRIRVLKNGVYDWEYAPNLNVGDVAILAKNISNGVIEYADLKTEQELKHHNSSYCRLPEKLDEQLAEFLGLFTGDGSIKFRSEHKTTTKPDAIRFPIFGDDEDLTQWLVKRIEDLFGIQTNAKKSLSVNIWETTSHSVTVCNYLIDNEFSKKDYVSKGFHGKNHVYHIPELIFKSPKSVICAYLRGLFEADGCISNGAIAFTSKFKHMVEEVQELLTYVGIQSFIAKKENRKSSFGKNIYVLTIRFKDSCILFKENIHFLSNRKNEKLNNHSFEEDREKVYIPKENFQKYQTELSKKLTCKSKVYLNLAVLKSGSKNINEHYYVLNKNIVRDLVEHTSLKMPFDLDNYFNLKIKKITREEFKTFDIEVLNDNHTYITANGVINHNTLSLMMRDFVMSYGVEPGFGIYFWKRSRMSGSYQYYFCVPHVVRQVFAEHGYPIPMESDTLLDTWDGALGKPIAKFIDENKDKIGIKFKNSTEIKALDKLDLMSKLMQYVDSSISVTYSLPHDATWEDTYNLIIEANKRGVKSIAAFPDKKMYGIVSFMPFKELAVSLKTDNIAIHPTNFNEEELKELNIIGDEVKNNTYSPKRLKELDADIHIVTASGKKYIMVVGMQRDRPYELFGGLIKDGLVFKQAQKKGKIVKIKKGTYSLEIGEEIVIENFGEYFTAVEQSFFRLVSLHLRKGTPIKEIAEQLSEASDDMVSLTAAASRVLRKYIKNGEEVVGMKCPSCGKGNLYYNGGCASCSCGWEKCS